MPRPSNRLLQQVTLFAELDDETLDRLAGEFFERRYAAGDEIVGEGESGRTFFLIAEGEATVTIAGSVVATLGAGDSFGEIALIDRKGRTATITAATDVHAYLLPVWSFRPVIEHDAELTWKLLAAVAGRIRAAEDRAAD
jgi:CRP/FNR family cyclic AMP-dependent transcriptional regulator